MLPMNRTKFWLFILVFLIIVVITLFLFKMPIFTDNTNKSKIQKNMPQRKTEQLSEINNDNLEIILIENRRKLFIIKEDRNDLILKREIYSKNEEEIFGRSIFVDDKENLNFIKKKKTGFHIDRINIDGSLLDSRKLLNDSATEKIRDIVFSVDGKYILINVLIKTLATFDLYYSNINELEKGYVEKLKYSKNFSNLNPLYHICDSGAILAMHISPDMNYISFIEVMEDYYHGKDKRTWKSLQVYNIKSKMKVLSIKAGDHGFGRFNQIWSPSADHILFVKDSPVNRYEVCR